MAVPLPASPPSTYCTLLAPRVDSLVNIRTHCVLGGAFSQSFGGGPVRRSALTLTRSDTCGRREVHADVGSVAISVFPRAGRGMEGASLRAAAGSDVTHCAFRIQFLNFDGEGKFRRRFVDIGSWTGHRSQYYLLDRDSHYLFCITNWSEPPHFP